MKTFKIRVEVTEYYDLFVDADDEYEAAEKVYDMSKDDIVSGEYIDDPYFLPEVTKVEEVPFYLEDN